MDKKEKENSKAPGIIFMIVGFIIGVIIPSFKVGQGVITMDDQLIYFVIGLILIGFGIIINKINTQSK